MLDQCPHHHDDEQAAADQALAELKLRTPRSNKTLWRSLDELAKSPAFEKSLHREFPHLASEWDDGPSRRNFLKLMSASLALAGVAGSAACTKVKDDEPIVPYVNPPEGMIPGKAMYYATAMPFGGYGKGVLVEQHEGRPTKIEGNPDHPASLGAADAFMQASVLELYDPDRSQSVIRTGDVSSWGTFADYIKGELQTLKEKAGKGLYFLSETITSPTVGRQMAMLMKAYPQAKWFTYDAVSRDNTRAGAALALGTPANTVYAIDKADVIVSLDANFLADDPGSLRYARQFADRRRMRKGEILSGKMNRLYTVESQPSITGAMADHKLAIQSGQIGAFAMQLLGALTGAAASGANATFINALAKDLNANRGKAVAIAGETQPPEVHAVVHAINGVIGAIGTTVTYTDQVEVTPNGAGHSIADFMADVNAGLVDTLFILNGNPLFNAPAELNLSIGLDDRKKFPENPLQKSNIRIRIRYGLYEDETSNLCHWHLPASHYLESWGDIRAFDGSASIIQPLISPLYRSKSLVELFAILLGEEDKGAYDIVRETWQAANLPGSFNLTWQQLLDRGVVPNSAFAAKSLTPKAPAASATQPAPAADQIEVVFRPDPAIWDGSWANNGWLQELPKPITKLTWDNAIIISPATAKKFGAEERQKNPGNDHGWSNQQVVEITVGDRKVRGPLWIQPGCAEGTFTVYLGGGRMSQQLKTATGVGFNAYAIRTSAMPWIIPADQVKVESTDEEHKLACVQSHQNIEGKELDGRDLLHVYSLKEAEERAKEKLKPTTEKGIALPILNGHQQTRKEFEDAENAKESLYPSYDYHDGDPRYNKWGMVIDTNACIGCNACVVACQSENNIPVVGKEQVMRGREMHWIRIDTYYMGGTEENPDSAAGPYFEPLPCMNCENAPCEPVCPVQATSHSAEGINEMTYNRCVGTRYCANNCPYKVRRFNFLHFQPLSLDTQSLQRNPNVTVRSRGVMEKCNYCVQRVNLARIEAKKDGARPIRDGEVVPACGQSCPTNAIIFGNLNDATSAVYAAASDPLNHALLEELNTRPRTTYLNRVTNMNPELAPAEAPHEA